MTVSSYEELGSHLGHSVYVAVYGDENAVVECEDCSEILVEFMNPDYTDEDLDVT